jgi:hypothetical protein
LELGENTPRLLLFVHLNWIPAAAGPPGSSHDY